VLLELAERATSLGRRLDFEELLEARPLVSHLEVHAKEFSHARIRPP
jgi:hypothetical protein